MVFFSYEQAVGPALYCTALFILVDRYIHDQESPSSASLSLFGLGLFGEPDHVLENFPRLTGPESHTALS